MGEEGNADVLSVHAPKSELDLMDKGFGRTAGWSRHNDFIIVGPASDPAGIKGLTTAGDAYKKIAESKSIFVTRGDDSVTNKAELTIWKSAEITPEGDRYVSTGRGRVTLSVLPRKRRDTFPDRASYLALKDTLQLDATGRR